MGAAIITTGGENRRKPDTGLERPYRPKPSEFRETYIRMGWEGIEEEFNTNWRCIRRWILEQIEEDIAKGRIDLRAARANWLAENGINVRRQELRGSRRSDYVSGRRMRPARTFDWGSIPPRAQMNLVLEEDMHGFTPPNGKPLVAVTDHARVKYLEHVVGIDMVLVDQAIRSPAMEVARDFGASTVIMKTGHKAIIRDGAVVTIFEKGRRR